MEDAIFCFIGAAIFLLISAFCIFCSVRNFDWFFNNSKARPLVKMFGRNGARAIYIGIGVFLAIFGLMSVGGGILMLGQ